MGPTNELLIRAGCLGAGLLIGSQITYILARNKFLKSLDRIVHQESVDARDYYRKYYQDLYDRDVEFPEPLPPAQFVTKVPEKAVLEETDLADADLLAEYESMEELLDYQGSVVNTNTTDEEDVPMNPTGDPKIPYRLSATQFSNEEVGYEKFIVTYYPEDGVIVDDASEEPSPTANKAIGQENLDFLMSEDADWTIYVRNDAVQMDFEVNLAEGSYSVPV
jgi:hypothetical protein